MPRQADQFEGDAGDHRQQAQLGGDALENAQVRAEQREDRDLQEQGDEQEAGPAPRVDGREGEGVVGGQLLARFDAVDDLVFGTVVLEEALDFRHERDGAQVADEQPNPDQALDGAQGERVRDEGGELGEDEGGDHLEDGDHDDHPQEQREPAAALGLLLVLAGGDRRRIVEHAHAQRERLDQGGHAADEGELEHGILGPQALDRLLLEMDVAARRADGEPDPVLTAHHDPLDDGLAADGVYFQDFAHRSSLKTRRTTSPSAPSTPSALSPRVTWTPPALPMVTSRPSSSGQLMV
ncbi:hypothetical protein D3C86_1315210 [compost metagenome]